MTIAPDRLDELDFPTEVEDPAEPSLLSHMLKWPNPFDELPVPPAVIGDATGVTVEDLAAAMQRARDPRCTFCGGPADGHGHGGGYTLDSILSLRLGIVGGGGAGGSAVPVTLIGNAVYNPVSPLSVLGGMWEDPSSPCYCSPSRMMLFAQAEPGAWIAPYLARAEARRRTRLRVAAALAAVYLVALLAFLLV